MIYPLNRILRINTQRKAKKAAYRIQLNFLKPGPTRLTIC